MSKVYKKLIHCYQSIRGMTSFQPKVALVLGSGLGEYAQTIKIEQTIDYHEIEGFPVSTVSGHKGKFVFGHIANVPVVIMQGRVHYYEGYAIEDVVLPIRLMRKMGAEVLFLTNAAGGIHPDFRAGDFMMITDHISNFVPSPLIGPNEDELGERFPDMSEVYNKDLQKVIQKAAKSLSIPLQKGVYVQLSGPNFETPAEVQMCKILGADAVGMSTACEALAANHMGMKVCGISCISNQAAGISSQPLSHQEVQEMADIAAPRFQRLVTESIKQIGMKILS